MSLDASYILVYDVLSYIMPTPVDQDILFLDKEYGGYFKRFNHGYSIYWEKPKYCLSADEIQKLNADQVLERKDCERWVIVK